MSNNPFKKSLVRSNIAILSVLMTLGFVQAYAVDALFLDLAQIKGESSDPAHLDEIDVLGFAQNITTSNASTANGGAAGGAVYSGLTITKNVDSASPIIMQRCVDAEHIPSAHLTVRKGGNLPIEYYRLTLTDVVVSSVQISEGAGVSAISEVIVLNCSKIHLDYFPQDDKGKAGTAVPFNWTIPTNTIAIENWNAIEPIQSVQISPGQFQLSWAATGGKSYRILAATDLTGPFQVIQSVSAATTGTLGLTLATDGNRKFFKIEEGP